MEREIYTEIFNFPPPQGFLPQMDELYFTTAVVKYSN
jgi:hypothetical protein